MTQRILIVGGGDVTASAVRSALAETDIVVLQSDDTEIDPDSESVWDIAPEVRRDMVIRIVEDRRIGEYDLAVERGVAPVKDKAPIFFDAKPHHGSPRSFRETRRSQRRR